MDTEIAWFGVFSWLVFLLGSTPVVVGRGVNGGTACVACVGIVGLVEQLAEIHNETISDSFARLCRYLPKELQDTCKLLVKDFGPGLIPVLEKQYTADFACHSVDLCRQDGPQMCHLFPIPPSVRDPSEMVQEATKLALSKRGRPFLDLPAICKLPVIKDVCKVIDNFKDDNEPIDDTDGDKFSQLHTFRGADWRGKDCDDFNKEVYPGRYSTNDAYSDTNCNGIMGIDPQTNKTYEEQWCNGTHQLGTVVLGDSVGAHFHIPPEWLTASQLNDNSFADILTIVENELDWPMLSLTTGFDDPSKWVRDIQGPMNSTYLILRERNLCNHRDFQNVAVNGARSSSMKKIVKTLSRNKTTDIPVLVTLELVGNDVCNGYNDTFAHMTKPEEYYENMNYVLSYLDDTLPKGSIVNVVGLVDGRILYETLHDRIHPLGSTRKDVTYSQLYDFLNCLQVSPCYGWLNSNETWRNLTTEHANELNDALSRLISSTQYNNIVVNDFPLPLREILEDWKNHGNDPAKLIEPVDGFHPSQTANALIASKAWDLFMQKYPNLVPPVNPNNEHIKKQFGGQGGY